MPNPDSNATPARQLLIAAGAFLLPLAIFFGWFFGFRAVGFRFVLGALLLLMLASFVARRRHSSSPLVGLGATWLTTGCVAALFWALLINGFG